MGGKTHDVGQNAGMDVCLPLCKLNLSGSGIEDITQMFLCARMTVVKNAGINDKEAVTSFQ